MWSEKSRGVDVKLGGESRIDLRLASERASATRSAASPSSGPHGSGGGRMAGCGLERARLAGGAPSTKSREREHATAAAPGGTDEGECRGLAFVCWRDCGWSFDTIRVVRVQGNRRNDEFEIATGPAAVLGGSECTAGRGQRGARPRSRGGRTRSWPNRLLTRRLLQTTAAEETGGDG